MFSISEVNMTVIQILLINSRKWAESQSPETGKWAWGKNSFWCYEKYINLYSSAVCESSVNKDCLKKITANSLCDAVYYNHDTYKQHNMIIVLRFFCERNEITDHGVGQLGVSQCHRWRVLGSWLFVYNVFKSTSLPVQMAQRVMVGGDTRFLRGEIHQLESHLERKEREVTQLEKEMGKERKANEEVWCTFNLVTFGWMLISMLQQSPIQIYIHCIICIPQLALRAEEAEEKNRRLKREVSAPHCETANQYLTFLLFAFC